MKPIRFIPEKTNFDFVRMHKAAFALTAFLVLASVVSLVVQGLNLGIDFRGGILIEVAASDDVDVGDLRSRIGGLGLGEVEIQNFGGPRDVMIRVQRQEGGEQEQERAIRAVRAELGDGYEYRRVEFVGPKVGAELLRDGILATLLAVAGIALYVGFRFEWQFGVSAMISTFHDVAVTVGLFSLLQLEFNLTAIAALLTLAGYSINDTVVVFDRIREILRKRKSATLTDIINESVNATLSRTILTGGTTLLALVPLLIYGGDTLFNFSLAMTWGILVGTFSSIFVAATMLLYMPAVGRRRAGEAQGATLGTAAAEPKGGS